MSEFSKTALYEGWPNLPPLVQKAVQLSLDMGFISSCTPYHGELLAVLARGREGGVIGETGTGCGVGLAWMIAAVSPATRLVSVERDRERAAACRALFAGIPNVTLLEGDWRAIEAHAPFDLLVLDGGGGGKGAGKAAADPARLLTPGGSIVLDDMHPPLRYWPEESGRELDAHGHAVVEGRAYWLNRPDVFASEVRVHPQVSTLIATLKAPKPGG